MPALLPQARCWRWAACGRMYAAPPRPCSRWPSWPRHLRRPGLTAADRRPLPGLRPPSGRRGVRTVGGSDVVTGSGLSRCRDTWELGCCATDLQASCRCLAVFLHHRGGPNVDGRRRVVMAGFSEAEPARQLRCYATKDCLCCTWECGQPQTGQLPSGSKALLIEPARIQEDRLRISDLDRQGLTLDRRSGWRLGGEGAHRRRPCVGLFGCEPRALLLPGDELQLESAIRGLSEDG